MILDIGLPYEAVPLVLIIGMVLVIVGRETLEVLSFTIGALAGGIVAYMVLNGLLLPYDIALWIKLLVGAVFIFAGGMLGKGAMATMLALATTLVFLDVLNAALGPDMLFVTIIAGVFIFALFVALIQKFVHVFSAFLGGALVAVPLNLLPFADDLTLRIVQLAVALVLMAVGGYAQYRLKKWKDTHGEQVTWVPS